MVPWRSVRTKMSYLSQFFQNFDFDAFRAICEFALYFLKDFSRLEFGARKCLKQLKNYKISFLRRITNFYRNLMIGPSKNRIFSEVFVSKHIFVILCLFTPYFAPFPQVIGKPLCKIYKVRLSAYYLRKWTKIEGKKTKYAKSFF